MRLPHLAWRRLKLTAADEARRVETDRDRHQPEGDRPRPDRMRWHDTPSRPGNPRRDEAFCTVPRGPLCFKAPAGCPTTWGRRAGRGPAPSDRRASSSARRLPAEARPRPYPRALRGRTIGDGRALRRPAARRPAPSLRSPPGDGRGAQELGRPQGAVGPAGGQAPGRSRRGPSARVRRLRGGDPEGQLRGRRRHRLGPRALPLGEARGSPGPARARAGRGGASAATSSVVAGPSRG